MIRKKAVRKTEGWNLLSCPGDELTFHRKQARLFINTPFCSNFLLHNGLMEALNHLPIDTKTLIGSGMFLLSALLVCFCLFILLNTPGSYLHLIIVSSCLGIVSCVTEAISGNGYDNLTIPVAVLQMLTILN